MCLIEPCVSGPTQSTISELSIHCRLSCQLLTARPSDAADQATWLPATRHGPKASPQSRSGNVNQLIVYSFTSSPVLTTGIQTTELQHKHHYWKKNLYTWLATCIVMWQMYIHGHKHSVIVDGCKQFSLTVRKTDYFRIQEKLSHPEDRGSFSWIFVSTKQYDATLSA